MSTGEDKIENKVNDGDTSFEQLEDNPDIEKFENDKRHLTNKEIYFPTEVWKKVTDKMGKKEDVENCSNASLFFASLLQEKRENIVVLPAVWKALGKRFVDGKNRDTSYKEIKEIIPRNVRAPAVSTEFFYRITGLLKCRLVSKSWNKAIENFFEDHQNSESAIKNWHYRFYWFTFGSVFASSPQQFFEHFETRQNDLPMITGMQGGGGRQGELSSLMNPFLGRGIHISYDADDDMQAQVLHNGCLEIGRKYGQQVWHLGFDHFCSPDDPQIHKGYKKIVEIVQLMPNLKTLSIGCYCKTCRPHELQALEQEMANNPFPQLASLESIGILCVPVTMFHQIIHKNLHVSQLLVCRADRDINNHLDYPVLLGNFPNLSELQLDFRTMGDFQEFENYSFTLHLKKVSLIFESTFQPFIRWSRIFATLEAKLNAELCTHLELVLPVAIIPIETKFIMRDTLFQRLKFPNLQTFTLRNKMPHFLDFLLPSKNTLSHLRLFNRKWSDFKLEERYQKLADKQIIKLIGNTENIELSNIQSELPNIHTLSLMRDTYSEAESSRYKFGRDGGVKKREFVYVNRY